MTNPQQLPPSWVETQATPALTQKDSGDPGGDLITAGVAKISLNSASITGAAGVVSAGLVAVLSPFKDNHPLAIAAAVILAAVALSAAFIIAADLTSRARVTSARLTAIGSVIDQAISEPPTQLQQAPQAGPAGGQVQNPETTAPTPPSPTQSSYSVGVPVVGFDCGSDGNPDHLLAVAWTPTSSDDKKPSGLMYLIAQEGGLPTWTDGVYGLKRVKLEPPASTE